MCNELWDEEEDDIDEATEGYYDELNRQVMLEEMNIDYEHVREEEEQPRTNIQPPVTTIHPPPDPFADFSPMPLDQRQLLDIERFVSAELHDKLRSALMADDPFFTDFITNFIATHTHDLSIPFSLRMVQGSDSVDLGKDSKLGFEDADLKIDFDDSKLVLEKNTNRSEGEDSQFYMW